MAPQAGGNLNENNAQFPLWAFKKGRTYRESGNEPPDIKKATLVLTEGDFRKEHKLRVETNLYDCISTKLHIISSPHLSFLRGFKLWIR